MLKYSFIQSEEKPDVSQVMAQRELNTVLASDLLQSSEILARFLEFVVRETLAGRSFEIKEYTIGLQVFKRPASFNPQKDAIVRISAGRLRRLLKRYYEGPGKTDEIRISIPTGTYIPVFKHRDDVEILPHAGKAAHRDITIAIIPFSNIGADHTMDYFMNGLAEQLTMALTATREYEVIAFGSSRIYHSDLDFCTIGKKLNADYLVTGSIRFSATVLRLNIQLVFARDATLVWTDTYEKVLDGGDLYALQDEIVERIYHSIGNVNGVFLRHLGRLSEAGRYEVLEGHGASFWFFLFKKLYSPDALSMSRRAIDEIVAGNPFYSTGYAVRGHLFADSYLLNLRWSPDPLHVAREYTARSLELDPEDPYGLLTLAYLEIMDGNKESSLRAIEQATHAHVRSGALTGLAGVLLICAGEYESGFTLLEEHEHSNPYSSWLSDVASGLYYFARQDYASAALKIYTTGGYSHTVALVLRLAALGKLGDPSAPAEFHLLRKKYPTIVDEATSMFRKLVLDKRLVGDIIHGLSLAAESGNVVIRKSI